MRCNESKGNDCCGKTITLNVRVNPTAKQQAESILAHLGIPMSTAVDMYLNQISLNGGIPFVVTLPKVLPEVNADLMNTAEVHAELQKGYTDVEAGKVQEAASAFAQFQKRH